MDAARPTAPVEQLIRAIERRTGLNLSGSRRPGATAGLARAMAAIGVGDHDQYRRLLQRDGAVFDALVAALTVGETYFLRERPQIALLRHHILPDVLERHGPSHRVELWSAGCATGEEPYTLAMVLEEEGLGRRSRVLGTDLSPAALRRAEAGIYGQWSLRAMSSDERETWLEPVGRRFRVRELLARRVRFASRNLVDGPPPACGPFDVVFCRNVLIYLVPTAVEQVTRSLLGSLRPGGWLVTASSDPHLEADGLERVRTSHGIAYRRSDGEARPVPAAPCPAPRRSSAPVATSAPTPAPARAASRPARAPQQARTHDELLAAAGRAFQESRYPEAAGLATEAMAAGGGARARALLVRSLANGGRLAEALSAARAAVPAHPLDAELRYLQAVLEAEHGRFADAAAAASTALYLEPGLAVAHLVQARAARGLGDEVGAQRWLRNAKRLLEAFPADEPVPLADGERAGLVLASVDAQEGVARRPAGGRR